VPVTAGALERVVVRMRTSGLFFPKYGPPTEIRGGITSIISPLDSWALSLVLHTSLASWRSASAW